MVKTNNYPAQGIAKGKKSKCPPTSATSTEEAPVASNTAAAAIDSKNAGSQSASVPLGIYPNGRNKRPEVIDVAIEEAAYFHADRKAYARIPIYEGSNRIGSEVCLVESPRFADWLAHVEIRERGEGLTGAARKKLVSTLKSRALFMSPERVVHLRVAHHEGAYYIDLGDKASRAFKITADGWSIVKDPPIIFVRSADSVPFVEPLPPGKGNIDNLWQIVNVPEGDRDVVLTYMLDSLRPETPYPLLFLRAGYGSAKSTTQRNIRMLIDPSCNPFGGNATTTRDLRAIAANTHVVSMENVSELRGEIQDMLCVLATGGAGGSARKLHSDADVHSISVKRPVIVNSIVQPITRSDLLSRTLTVSPVQPTAYMTESEIRALETKLMPGILGGFLDLFSASLRELPRVVLSEEARRHRLADYVKLGEAVCYARGKKAGEFVSMYTARRQNEAVELADDHPVTTWIVRQLEKKDEIKETMGNLLERILGFKATLPGGGKGLPKTPKGLRDELNRLKPTLEHAGIKVDFKGLSAGRSVVSLSLIEGSPLAKAKGAAKAAEVAKVEAKKAKAANDPYAAARARNNAEVAAKWQEKGLQAKAVGGAAWKEWQTKDARRKAAHAELEARMAKRRAAAA